MALLENPNLRPDLLVCRGDILMPPQERLVVPLSFTLLVFCHLLRTVVLLCWVLLRLTKPHLWGQEFDMLPQLQL